MWHRRNTETYWGGMLNAGGAVRSGFGVVSDGADAGRPRHGFCSEEVVKNSPPLLPPTTRGASHLFTVVLEDYFQVGAFRNLVDRQHWYRFESRIERSAEHVLALLRASDSRATFFVLGWVADQLPELIRRIAEAGHEVADRGYLHLPAATLSPGAFLDDVRQGREAVARASGRPVVGHRCCGWLPDTATARLSVLATEGYHYDSSARTLGFRTAQREQHSRPYEQSWGGRRLHEVPVSSVAIGPLLVPAAGGAWLRHLPAFMLGQAQERARRLDVPFISCVHSWELDPEQPRIAASWLARLRHYRNLDGMQERVHQLLTASSTSSIAAWMGIPLEERDAPAEAAVSPHVLRPANGTGVASPPTLSIAIPCYNEASGLGYLERTLESVSRCLALDHAVEFVFVDDGSRDATWAELQRRFGHRTDCTLVQHVRNRGVGAAIRTGVEAAHAPIVASIDADCSYDPHEIAHMVSRLTNDVVLVTASPYHPEGGVRNVPAWRLLLSRGLSLLYRPLLHTRIHTITSCCRVYRRDAVLAVPTQFDDYRGIAEWLVRIDLAGGRIVEHPTMLASRLLGTSKMNVLRSIAGHLALIVEVIGRRLAGSRDHLGAADPTPTGERATTAAVATMR